MNECGYVLMKLNLQKKAAGYIWPTGCWLWTTYRRLNEAFHSTASHAHIFPLSSSVVTIDQLSFLFSKFTSSTCSLDPTPYPVKDVATASLFFLLHHQFFSVISPSFKKQTKQENTT